MNKTTSSVYTVTIFYNQSEWHKLIRKFIEPLHNKAIETELFEFLHIYLGTYKGDHVEVRFNYSDDDGNLILKFSTDLTLFLSQNQSFTIPTSYPLSGFFMDFPNNTFILNKNSIDFSEKFNKNELQIVRAKITSFILKVLASNDIDVETLFTFVIYLQLGFIKTSFPSVHEAYLNMSNLADSFFLKGDIKSDLVADMLTKEYSDPIKKLFEDNKTMLKEIIDEIWYSNYIDPAMSWMKEWEACCKLILGVYDFQQSFIAISEAIYQQIGASKNTSQINVSIQMISESLKMFNENSH